MSDNVVTFQVELPGARRKHELKFTLGETRSEKYDCIKIKRCADSTQNELMVWIILRKALQGHPESVRITELLNNEIGVLKLLDHKHIVKLFHVFASEGHTYVVTERADLTLAQYVEKKGGKLSVNTALTLFNELLSAVSYLHSKGLAHRAISPENILLVDDDDDASLKLAEFGLSCLQGSREIKSDHPGKGLHQNFTAPEMREAQGQYHGKIVDTFSCGAVLYFMLTGKPMPLDPLEAPKDADLIPAAAELIGRATSPTWMKVEGVGRCTLDELRRDPWVLTTRKHSSIDVSRGVINAAQLQRASLNASDLAFQRDAAEAAARASAAHDKKAKGGLSVATAAEEDGSNDRSGCSSPESLLDDTFSPLPKRGPREFGDLQPMVSRGMSGALDPPGGKTDMLTLDAGGGLDGMSGFDLSPPCSPSMKAKRQLKLNTLGGTEAEETVDGVAEDDDYAQSPMGHKASNRDKMAGLAAAAAAGEVGGS
eukprot:TRINITY_DN3412_c0_g1_i2.p1 TRINITY_DN3412_c0_g1~~TRINITY_DN3412_c0_g1_i2.p1  ORF type:complete len:484 (+),score=167.38 TRINITY_DN3412_c0_g1_i2:151-1602(+)